MRQRWLSRLAFVSAAVGIAALATAAPAWANTASTPDLHQTNVTLAGSDFDQGFGECSEVPDQAPDQDVWVFVWPGTSNDDELVKLELNFDSDGDGVADTTLTEADATATTDSGTLKAWVTTPAGWTLISGTSEITGEVSLEINGTFYFNLTHGCAGTPATPTPSGSPTPSETPSVTPSETPSESGSSTPGATSSAPGGGGGGLPVTGTAIGGIVVVGVGLVAAGVALLAVRRRREIDLTDL
jgi:LPXTG-motif cell wall-anchored protein